MFYAVLAAVSASHCHNGGTEGRDLFGSISVGFNNCHLTLRESHLVRHSSSNPQIKVGKKVEC